MNTTLVALLLSAATIASPPVWSQATTGAMTDMQALRAAVKTDKRALVASTLALTDAEAKKFWPLYDDYQRTLDATARQRAIVVEDLVARDKPPSDLHARELAGKLIAADEAEIKARRRLQKAAMKVLPAKKAFRYLQLEAKIRAYQDYDIASVFPLINAGLLEDAALRPVVAVGAVR